jgi:holo-[acyl-carrier protein] synthase
VVLAVGLDIVEIERIARAMRNPRFSERILTPREREIEFSPSRLAGRWAAKEAVAKAVGLHLNWHQVEILGDPHGRPIASIHDPHFDPSRHRLHLSITHERTHAVAVAVFEDTRFLSEIAIAGRQPEF